MKASIITSLLLAVSVSVSAQVRWLNQENDFGAFSEDLGSVDTQFLMVNDTDKPVKIVDARATCGCTVPRYPKGEIAPGDTAAVTVTYHATQRPGKFTKYVYVKTSDNPSVQRTLTIIGTVIGSTATIRSRYPADAGPMKLHADQAYFGEVKKGKLKTIFIEAYNQSEDSVQPALLDLPVYITGTVKPEKVGPGEIAQIALTLNSYKVPEWGINETKFKFRPAEGQEPVELTASVIITEDFSTLTPGQKVNAPVCKVEPDKVDLGEISATADPIKVEFEVHNTGKSPLIIRRVQSIDPAIVSAVLKSDKIKAGKSTKLTLMVDHSKAANDFVNARVTLISNSPDNPLAVVRVTAELKH